MDIYPELANTYPEVPDREIVAAVGLFCGREKGLVPG